MKNKKRVLVSVPTCHRDPYIHKDVCMVTDKLLMDNRYSITLIRPSFTPYEENLHQIVRKFVEEEFDFWLNIDSDNPPQKNPLDLVSLDKDVIGLPTPIWLFNPEKKGERPIYLNGYKYVPEVGEYTEYTPIDGLQEVEAIGTGCFLVARRVFLHPDMQKGAFLRKTKEFGLVDKGNDISFSERARACGFRLWCHYDYMCNHYKELELNMVMRAMYNFRVRTKIDI